MDSMYRSGLYSIPKLKEMIKKIFIALAISVLVGLPIAIIAVITKSVTLGIVAGGLQMVTYFANLIHVGALKINDKTESQ